jgi:methyl-accepting chemotaxis protein
MQSLGLRLRLALMALLFFVPIFAMGIALISQFQPQDPGVATGIFIAVLGLCLMVYLSAAFYLSIVASAKALSIVVLDAAQGDLSRTVVVAGSDEFARAGRHLESMSENFSGLVGTIRNQAVHVAQAGESLTSNMSDMSQRTEAQAASLEQASASIFGLNESVQNTASRAKEVNTLTQRVRSEAEAGAQAMDMAVRAIEDIQSSAKHMGEIVGVIDGIAFQTNILALNAAVEAARAGESGRGFAVVASEVRTLAQRSAASAREIRDLIANSTHQVSDGVARIGAVTDNLRTVVYGIHEVAGGLDGIASASTEQSATLSEIAQAVKELDNITQRNGAMVDDALHATMELRDGATHLSEAVASIKLRRGTADEAYAMVKRGFDLIQRDGLANAARQFHDPQGAFRDRDLYIFVFDRNGRYDVFGSTPDRVGNTTYDVRGLDGAHVIREGFAAAERGGGWIDYEVVNPTNGIVDEKTSYILPLDENRLIGCGVFKPKGGFNLHAT